MNTNQPENRKNSPEKPFSAGEIVLLVLSVLLLSCGLFVFGWYGSTYIPLRHTSEIHAKDLVIRAGGQQCTLEIPSGKLSIRRPSRAVVGSKYHAEADVVWAQPLRFKDCSGGIPNWDINLEAQTGFVGSEVIPFSAIRQPVFNRNDFSFQWTFTPQETVAEYPSHFYLRVIVANGENVVENWSLLVRDFPMQNTQLFGQPIVLWFIAGSFSAAAGILLLILLVQKRKKTAVRIKTEGNDRRGV